VLTREFIPHLRGDARQSAERREGREKDAGSVLPRASSIGGLLSRCFRSKLFIPLHSRVSVVFV